ncbi:MAG: hypothetical protein JWL82_486 [Parcubacteria group bacterium]|nr:hypothetical protein [Parcubacteria group bacterium]
MNNKSYGWALILLLLIFGIAAIFAYQRNHARTAALPVVTDLAVYPNDTYGYSFYYAPEYTVRVASEDTVLIGMMAGTRFDAFAEAKVATSSDSSGSYDDFVLTSLRTLCACTDTPTKTVYTNEAGLVGAEYALNGSAGTTIGPVYAFNIGGNVTDAKYAALLVYRPLDATGATEGLRAENLAGTVDIHKAINR